MSNMLHATLYFYPDARKNGRQRVGEVFFQRVNNDIVPFVVPSRDLVAVIDGVTNASMRAILADLNGYIEDVAKLSSRTTDLMKVAQTVVSCFPSNLRVTEFLEFPPESLDEKLRESLRAHPVIFEPAIA